MKNTYKCYGIVNKKNIVKLSGENTTKSRYMIKPANTTNFVWDANEITIKRKLASREQARAYKRSLKNSNNWSIVDLRHGEVVR